MLDIQAGKPQEADQLAREASKIDGKEPLAFLIIGRAMLDEKRFMDALPPLSTAIRLSPENAEGHLYLEQAYRHLGKLDEARREHSEFERRKAENDPTQYNVEPTPKAQ
jgi:predicted Zn-dependent protease